MVPGEVAQIKIGDYVIPKKDKCVLVCTNVLDEHNDAFDRVSYIFCFEVAFEEVDDYGPDVVILDMLEILKFEGTLIKKNTQKARNLEILYGKV